MSCITLHSEPDALGFSTRKIATGISVKRSTGIVCEGNILRVSVDSDSQNARATGISVDESSIVTADKNDITATTIIRGPPDNCKNDTIASGMSSTGAIALFKSGYIIIASEQHHSSRFHLLTPNTFPQILSANTHISPVGYYVCVHSQSAAEQN